MRRDERHEDEEEYVMLDDIDTCVFVDVGTEDEFDFVFEDVLDVAFIEEHV